MNDKELYELQTDIVEFIKYRCPHGKVKEYELYCTLNDEICLLDYFEWKNRIDGCEFIKELKKGD